MDIRDLYELVSTKLDKINFDSLTTGFKRYRFALYDNAKVYLENDEIPVNNRFLGNTNIDYEGEQIAIWNVANENEDLDTDLFVSNIVHEMFH